MKLKESLDRNNRSVALLIEDKEYEKKAEDIRKSFIERNK